MDILTKIHRIYANVMCLLGMLWRYKTLMWYRFTSKTIHVCKYGKHFRSTVDIYLPQEANKNKHYPVLIFNPGSVWLFGGKFLAIPFAALLQKLGVITVAIDYARYPFSSIDEQIDECAKAITWVLNNIERYNGDVDNVTVVGYSAGGHVMMNAMYNQLHSAHRWKLNGVILCSSVYNLHYILNHERHRNESGLLRRFFGDNYNKYCMTKRLLHMIETESIQCNDLPPIYIMNGDTDTTTDFDSAVTFYEFLKQNGFRTKLHCATGWDHTEVIEAQNWSVPVEHWLSVTDNHNIKNQYANARRYSMSFMTASNLYALNN